MINSGRLHRMLSKDAPISGITLADDNSLAGVEIIFEPSATQAERDAATARLAALTVEELEVPDTVTKYQFKLALYNLGRLDDVKAQAPNLSDEAKIYWEDNTIINIDSPLIQELQVLMGLTDAQVRVFFNTASGL